MWGIVASPSFTFTALGERVRVEALSSAPVLPFKNFSGDVSPQIILNRQPA